MSNVVKFLIGLVLAALLVFFFGITWMYGLQYFANVFHEPKLNIGFWKSLGLGVIVRILLGTFNINLNNE